MKMKTMIILFTMVVSIAILAGCGNSGSTPQTATTADVTTTAGVTTTVGETTTQSEETAAATQDNPSLSGELTYVVFSGEPYNSSWMAMFDQFTAKTGVTVHLDAVPWENLREKQTLELASGSGAYDVIYSHPSWYKQFAANGYLLPIDDYCTQADKDKFVPSLLGLFEYNDKIYGLPDWITTIMIAYRTDLFEEKGVDKPESWEEVLKLAELFTDGDNLYGIVFPAKNVASLAGTFLTNLLANDAWILDSNGNPTMDTPEALETVQYFEKLSKFAPPGYLNFHWDEVRTLAGNGKAAMAMLLTVSMRIFSDPDSSQVTGVWDYVPMKQKTTGGAIDCWSWAVVSSSKNIEAAGELVKFMTDTDVQLQLTKLNGTVGATKGYYESPEPMNLLPYLPAMNEAFAGKSLMLPTWESWQSEQDELEVSLQKMFSGEMTAEQVVTAVQEKMVANRK